MPVPRASGYPDYGYGGAGTPGNAWIPILFAGKTLEKFYTKCVAANISTTDYVGEVKNVGDRVVIRTVPNITIRTYQKGGSLTLEYPESPAIEFTINRAKYFNFAMDDIDVKETDIDWLSKYADDAAQQMKIVIDTEFFGSIYADADTYNKGANAGKKSGAFNLGTTGSPVTLTKANVLDYIVDCGTVLDEQDVPEDDRWIVVPPAVFNLINKSDLRNAAWSGLEKTTVIGGFTGKMLDRFNIFVSNLIPRVTSGGDAGAYHIPFGRKGAIVFVAQLTKTEKYRPQNTFADAMKGLMVYDFDVIMPIGVGELYAKVSLT